jgi:hypothetical protein
VTLTAFPDYHVEVKRDERMSVDAMLRQAQRDCGKRIPVLAWRRNRGKWMVAMPLEHFLNLIGGYQE